MVWFPCSIQGSFERLISIELPWSQLGLNCGLSLPPCSLDPLSLLPPLLRITLKPPWWSLSQSASSEIQGRKPYIEFCTKVMLFLCYFSWLLSLHIVKRDIGLLNLSMQYYSKWIPQKIRYQANALLFEAITFWIIFDNGPIPFLTLLFQLNRSLWSHVILNHNSC